MRRARPLLALVALGLALAYPAFLLARALAIDALIAAPNRWRTPSEPPAPPGVTAHHVAIEGGRLAVWRMAATTGPTDRTILVLHGVRDDRRAMIHYARSIAEAGFGVLLVDLRGHGGSSGEHLTYGARDGEDLVRVVEALAPNDRIGVYGPSYGGAAALQLAAREPRVRAVVTVATFSSLRDVVPVYAEHYMSPIARAIPGGFLESVYAGAEEQANFRVDEADTARVARSVRASVLLIHGEADEHIPVAQAHTLHGAISGSELFVVPGRDHLSIQNAPETRRATLAFFARTLPESP